MQMRPTDFNYMYMYPQKYKYFSSELFHAYALDK